MRVLVTGADSPLGGVAVAALRHDYDLRLTGTAELPPGGAEGLPYSAADLREPDQVTPLMEVIDAVLHLAPFAVADPADPLAEGELLDRVARGTFVLLHAALKGGASRMVLASRLDL